MSIRVKLLVIFLVLVLLSAGFLVTAGVTIVAKAIADSYEAVMITEVDESIKGAIDLLAELKYAERHAPDELIDQSYMENLSSQSHFYKGGLAVKLGSKLMYSKDIPTGEGFISQLNPLPSMDLERGSHHKDTDELRHITYNEKDYFYIDYSFKQDQGEITYYFIVDVSEIRNVRFGAQKNAFQVLGFLMIMVLGPLLFVITRDIIGPIRVLETGVKAISEGDLNVSISTKRRNELGQVIRYFDTMRIKLKGSIDAQVKMEENRKELLSSISHDLKTPITAIKGYVEGIRDGVANTPEKMERYLNVVYEKSLYLDALIDDLFLFSKLDLQKLPFNKQLVSVPDYIQQLSSKIAMSLAEEHQEFKVDWSTEKDDFEKLMLTIDMRHLDRVFMNLLENSIKYADPDKGTLKIQLRVSFVENGVQMCFVDNGLGISKEHLTRIFERFYRVDEARTSQNGTGLGLAISHQIVEQHSGTLTAESKVGEGTCMCIFLPTVDEIPGGATQ